MITHCEFLKYWPQNNINVDAYTIRVVILGFAFPAFAKISSHPPL